MPAPEELPGLSDETVSVIEGEVKKGKVRKFFLIARGATIRTLGVFKKGQFGPRIAEAKKSGFKGDVTYGVVSGSGKNLTFQFAGTPEVAEAMNVDGFIEAVPVKDTKLREFFSDNGLDFKVECQCITQVAQALVPTADDENDATSGTSTSPLPAPGPTTPSNNVAPDGDDATAQHKAKLEEALRALVPKIKQAAEDFPARKTEILGPVAAIKQQIEANQFDAAKQGISTVVQLLKQLSGTAPTETTPESVVQAPPEYTQLLDSVRPKYARAISEKLGDYEKFKKLMLFAEDKATAGDFASAQRALEGLAKALDAIAVATPSSNDPGVTLFAIGKARLEFEQLHNQAIQASEQTRDKILLKFKDDEEQELALERAIATMNAKIVNLRTDLNSQLDQVVNAAPTDRGKFAQAVRKQVDDYIDFLETDLVMSNLDGNEFLPDTNAIEPLKSKLDEIAGLLEKVTS